MNSKHTSSSSVFHINRKKATDTLIEGMTVISATHKIQLLFDPSTDKHVVYDTRFGHVHYTSSLADAQAYFNKKLL